MSKIGRAFVAFLTENRIITFSDEGFKLKSGRISPYFANFGSFNTGKLLNDLSRFYAEKIISERLNTFDVLFGPAYKGIPLVSATSVSLSYLSGRSDGYPWAFNRKEMKDHGEGGSIVGAPLGGQRVLIIDDVITAGTAIGEAIEIIRANDGIPIGVVIAFDRMERGKDGSLSAVQEVREKYGIPVHPIATLDDLLSYIDMFPPENGDDPFGEIAERIRTYQKEYGV